MYSGRVVLEKPLLRWYRRCCAPCLLGITNGPCARAKQGCTASCCGAASTEQNERVFEAVHEITLACERPTPLVFSDEDRGISMRHLTFGFATAAAAALLFVGSPPATAASNSKPTIAVINFSSEGLNWWWTAGVDPGAALAELLTDQLVNLDTMNVVDRSHIDSIMQEKNLKLSGDISPSTGMQLGRLLGAKYLIVGRIVQFDHTATNSGGLGGFTGPVLSNVGVKGEKVHLQVASRIIEVSTGRIIASIPEEQTHSSTSFSVSSFAPYVGGNYSSENFVNSTMGKIINDAAKDMAGKIDPAKMQGGGGSGVVINGHVLTIDGSDVVINKGSADGVTEGMYFGVFATHSVKDPDSGKMVTTRVKKGSIQITSVEAHSAQGKVTEGSASAGMAISAE